ncbi:MAG: ABC transporter ATP-binding protein [Gammaproteobacteria bacterium]|nr:ABC transporter ATP-binding protein [Gammaproteobacteria bacterium]MYJ51365.1 ABC transporter ATP-binding protein [Gammaproteobacteria bacterium]
MAAEAIDTASRKPAAPAIELRNITKSFGSIRANRNVSLTIERGTIHGIVGENGAGKSTLMSILYGFYRADEGEVRIHGIPTPIPDTRSAIRAGIGMVHQHFKLVHNLSVLENIVLGAEDDFILERSLTRARSLLLDLARDHQLEIDPDAIVEKLSVGLQQRVEILKALFRRADILILDEPTGVLAPSEAERLFAILRGLKNEGRTIVMITHKLHEVMAVTDTVSVMRRGEMVTTCRTCETDAGKLAEFMVGRKALFRVARDSAEPGERVLDIQDLSVVGRRGNEAVRRVSLCVHRGEIAGIAGVTDNGQAELLEALGGIRPATGTIRIAGREIDCSRRAASARSMHEAGLAHVPEDRQQLGLVLDFRAWENMALGYQHRFRRPRSRLLMDISALQDLTADRMRRFDVRPTNPSILAGRLSGGNQQKLVVAREFGNAPSVLVVGQPTRGVDIGAIEFIHRQIVALRDAGAAILLVSMDLDEILALTDRVAVMFDGRIVGERITAETDATELGLMMAGVVTESLQ